MLWWEVNEYRAVSIEAKKAVVEACSHNLTRDSFLKPAYQRPSTQSCTAAYPLCAEVPAR